MALTDNLVAYWRLDEASGTRADSSGNARSLTANGSPVSRTGKLGDAADFVPGSSQYLSTGDATVRGTITDAAGWTIAGWLYSDDNATRDILGHMSLGNKGLYARYFGSFGVARELIVQWYDDAASAVLASAGVSFTSAAWNFFAVQYNSSDDKLYLRSNGTTAAGVSCAGRTFTTYSTHFTLGRFGGSAGAYWDGGLDDIGLWSRTLSGAELDQLYNSGAGLDPTASTGSALPLFAAQMMAMR
jgi:hypothetical protein